MFGTINDETSIHIHDSTCTTSCKKLGVFGKPNIRKHSLTDTVHLANVISDFTIRFARVEENKTTTSKKISVGMIEAAKKMTNSINNIILCIVEMKDVS